MVAVCLAITAVSAIHLLVVLPVSSLDKGIDSVGHGRAPGWVGAGLHSSASSGIACPLPTAFLPALVFVQCLLPARV